MLNQAVVVIAFKKEFYVSFLSGVGQYLPTLITEVDPGYIRHLKKKSTVKERRTAIITILILSYISFSHFSLILFILRVKKILSSITEV